MKIFAYLSLLLILVVPSVADTGPQVVAKEGKTLVGNIEFISMKTTPKKILEILGEPSRKKTRATASGPEETLIYDDIGIVVRVVSRKGIDFVEKISFYFSQKPPFGVHESNPRSLYSGSITLAQIQFKQGKSVAELKSELLTAKLLDPKRKNSLHIKNFANNAWWIYPEYDDKPFTLGENLGLVEIWIKR